MVSAAVLTMRPVMFGMMDPSAANTLVASVTILLAGTVVAKAVVEGGFVLPPACVTAPLGFLLFLGLLQTVFATHVWPAELEFFAWVTHALVLLAVYALVARHTVDEADRTAPEEREALGRGVVAAVLATGAMVALFGVYQRYAILPTLTEEAAKSAVGRAILANPFGAMRMRTSEVFGPFVGTSNAMAAYLALLLPLALGLGAAAHRAGRKAAAVAGWAAAGLLAYCLFLTGSRGGGVAAAAGVSAAAVFYWREPIWRRLDATLPSDRKKRILVIVAAALLVTALVASAFVYLTHHSLSMRVRAGYWRTALSMIADRPLGVGLRNFGDHYALYKTPAAWEVREAHNVFLSLAAEAGIAAVVALVLLILGFLRVASHADPSEAGPGGAPPARRGGSREEREAVPEVATTGNLRALGLVGGFTALLICVVSGPWLNAGLPGIDTLGGKLMTAVLLAVWGAVFWLASSVDVRSSVLRAGIVGGVAAIFVHGLVDFTFRIRGIVFTVAALGAVALAISRAEPLQVRLRGWRGFARSTAVAFSLAFVLWRGVSRPMKLAWQSENAKTHGEWSARLDLLRYSVNAAASGARVDRGAIRKVLSGIRDPILSAAADELRVVVESGTDAAIKKTVRDFSQELDGLSADSLRKAWQFLEKCVDEEPGDERVVTRFAALGRKLRRRRVVRTSGGPNRPGNVGVETDRAVKEALERLAELSPARFAPRKMLGDLLARQGHLAEAAAALEKAASLYPEKPELWLHAGDARAFTDPGKSVRAYARALDANRLAEDERTMLYTHYWRSTPRRPHSHEFPQRLAEIDARLGRTPEVAFRRALMYAEIGGFAGAVAQADRAIELSTGDVQLELFRAIFLDMEAARARTGEARRAAEAAWQKLSALQADAPGGKRIADYTLRLVRSRRGAIRKAAAGR